MVTQQHLEGHYRADDIIHKAKKKSPWKYWDCSEIPAICPHRLIFPPEKCDKPWVMMVMHDFINHSWEGLVVKRHSPGGLKCDSHMQTGFVLLKWNKRIYLKQGYGCDMDGWDTSSHTKNINSTMSCGVEYLQIQEPTRAVRSVRAIWLQQQWWCDWGLLWETSLQKGALGSSRDNSFIVTVCRSYCRDL